MKPKKSSRQIFLFLYVTFSTVVLLLMPRTLQAASIKANAVTHPDTVTIGQPTEIRVEVFSDQGSPLVNAQVKISAGGGMFLDSNDTVIEGQTDSNGIYVAPWKCDQCAATYVFNIEVNKPGFQGWTGEATVNISSSPPPGQGTQIFATAGVDPPVVSPAQPTLIRVEAFSEQGNPIPYAIVTIHSGGGIFIDSNSTTIEDHTGPDGVFETSWKCLQCASAYILQIQVNKPGYKGWAGEARVEIVNNSL
jgi:hypothetical protein